LSLSADNKAKISGLIHDNPGIHLRELQRKLGVSFNSIRYNTEKMVGSGEIVCEKGPGYSRFYPLGMPEKSRLVYSVSRNKTTFKILRELTDQGMLTNKELAARTGFAKSTVSEHVHLLLGLNMVKLTLSLEGNFKVELQDREFVQSIVNKLNQAALRNDVVQNFVELWDF
jgi:predicted transcriptional regulator